MKQEAENISKVYTMKSFEETDIPEIYQLCIGNPTYYKYMNIEPTYENLKECLTALPDGKTMQDKTFVGFYDEGRLLALLDLIYHYPDEKTAFIGWFMMNKERQGKGVGTAIVEEIFTFLKEKGYYYVRLGYVKGNEESRCFWTKNGFAPIGVECETKHHTVVVMQREL